MVLFDDRLQAGSILAQRLFLLKERLNDPIVLGIPRGGVPVGFQVAGELRCKLDAIVLRKLPIPDNPEAGFGAVTLDETVIFNEGLLRQLRLPESRIRAIVAKVYEEVVRRNQVYRKGAPFPALKGRSVVITDDGLASGYTMLSAVTFAKEKNAGKVIVAVPVAHREACALIGKKADTVIALHVSDYPYFAVASFYRDFPDMSDEDVIGYLKGFAKKKQ